MFSLFPRFPSRTKQPPGFGIGDNASLANLPPGSRVRGMSGSYRSKARPLFTKKDLQDVSKQVDRRYNTRRKSDSKQLVSIKGLSGWKIYYEVSTGQLLSGAENKEWEVQQPKLRYSCYEQLVSAIEHFMLARASDTKQPISPKYAENPVAVDDALKTSLKSRKKTAEFQELNSILEFVFNVHNVTKVVGVAFHDPLQMTKFTNIHQSDRGGL
ncbi:hypothetical protein N7465_010735 [Penicillium sp. CMV-2018d]|nr:hypothetical protein N7465_010735 [Penicillium sp. CMV-2018d]